MYTIFTSLTENLSSAVFTTQCGRCYTVLTGPVCPLCRVFVLTCSVCNIPVRGKLTHFLSDLCISLVQVALISVCPVVMVVTHIISWTGSQITRSAPRAVAVNVLKPVDGFSVLFISAVQKNSKLCLYNYTRIRYHTCMLGN